MWNGTWNGTWNRMARDLPRIRTYIASFPGLHAQLLSLAVRIASDKSWAWRPGNEAIYTYI